VGLSEHHEFSSHSEQEILVGCDIPGLLFLLVKIKIFAGE